MSMSLFDSLIAKVSMMQKRSVHIKLLLSLGFLPIHYFDTIHAKEIRHLAPPILQEAHLGEHILCHRPMRRGAPDMSITTIPANDEHRLKVIATNAGHGGSGWTLGPGCAAHVNTMLINSQGEQDLTRETAITIVGAGALGLFTANDLLERGYENITIIAEEFDHLTSHRASGLLAPSSMDNDPEKQAILDEIGINAYRFYADIAQGKRPEFKGGAAILPVYFKDRNDKRLEPYVGIVMQEAKDVVVDFDNGTTRDMIVYDDGIFMDAAIMMDSLRKHVETKVNFVQKKITNFEEIPTKYIINCTGLGSQELNNDDAYVSVQGHLIMLKDQQPEQIASHLISLSYGKGITEDGQEVKRSFYLAPKKFSGTPTNDIGVIGGTYIEGADAYSPNYEEFEIIVKNAKDFYGIKD